MVRLHLAGLYPLGGVTTSKSEPLDGAREKVNPQAFDEVFSRFRMGQSFEAMVTRNALTFRILRADAVRKFPHQVSSTDRGTAIWERAVGLQTLDSNGDVQTEQSEEQFWLQPPE